MDYYILQIFLLVAIMLVEIVTFCYYFIKHKLKHCLRQKYTLTY